MPELVIDARAADLGGGLKVRRILPFQRRRMVGPFIFMDHAGPVLVAPDQRRQADVRPHPHIGLSTVSYLFSGEITHRDSLGVQQVIRPGEVNWMTAGRGISHSERFEDPAARAAAAVELIQTWVALPEAEEETAPAFEHYAPEALPVFHDGGVWMRLIAGDAYGLRNGVKTLSPLFYLHIVLRRGARLALPAGHSERAAYIAAGRLDVDGHTHDAGRMLVFGAAENPAIVAPEACTLLLLGGEPLGERFIWWNFVSSRRDRIEQAKADWKAGRIALPPADHDEFIPLPEDPTPRPAPEALS
ncbi:MAG: pirin family protein [Proteobacteria bacterium]|nr:pirin family protein [Pseudomonadota bacterium]